MTDKVSGIAPISGPDRRTAPRRQRDRRASARALTPLDVPGDPVPPAPPKSETDTAAAGFAAQLMGQNGARKGLRGGPPVLDAARAGYLGAEYSGPSDRRPKPGRTKDTDV